MSAQVRLSSAAFREEHSRLAKKFSELEAKNKKMRECLLALKTTKHEDSPCDELGSHMPWLCDVCKKIDEVLK